MHERPIIFSSPMILALLKGRKTVTRRIVRQAAAQPDSFAESAILGMFHCPYGAPGDRLWVREAWSPNQPVDVSNRGVRYRADSDKLYADRWRSPIHMPRWASRIDLEVTGVSVERLQDITEEDIVAEGLPAVDYGVADHPWALAAEQRAAFAQGWDTLNRERAPWASNPWVWVVRFRRFESEGK